jgi:tetratricopeptide (TPR) repeat protein
LLYKEEGMKKAALIMILFALFAAVAGAAIPNDDKDFRAGLKSYNSRNYEAAVKYFKEYINKKPDPTAYYLTGYALYKLGKFSEADEYFRDAYLIDPEYSLEKVGLVKKASGEVIAKKPALTKQSDPAVMQTQIDAKESQATKPVQTAPADQKAKAAEPPAPVAAQKPAAPAPSVPQPAATPKPPQAVPAPPAPAFPPVPMSKEMPAAGPAALVGIIAAFGMILVFIAIAVYVYYSLCLFLIAKKLDVPAPWTAWIPLVQIWTFVLSAGKPGWWVLLFLIPIVNFFIGMYLWMCITENLGKNKWLALLLLVPLVGIVFPAWLAFSKSEHSGGYTPPEEPLAE